MKAFNLFILPFLIMSCSLDIPEEENRIRWITEIEIPLGEESVNLGSLSDDSSIFIRPLNQYFDQEPVDDSIFIYRKQIEIESIKVGDKLEIDPISTSFSQSVEDVTIADIDKKIVSEIGTIKLEDIEPSDVDPFVFRDIYPDIENIDNGTSSSIPEFEITPILNPFSFDDFGHAEFSSGYLRITIDNGMVIPLGPPVLVQLQQLNGTDTVDIEGGSIEFDALIDANGGSATDSLDLSGMTLPGSIFVRITGNCQGTSGIAINIDEDAKNSSFVVGISANDLEVISAEAKIPEQVIEENGVISLEPDSNKVTRAVIQNGLLNINVDNYMSLGSQLSIIIPSIETPNGLAFQTTLDIIGDMIDQSDQNNMENHTLVMDAQNQSIDYNYTVLTTDSGDDLVPIDAEDSIVVTISLSGENLGEDLTFSEFQGFLSQEAMIDSNIIELETETKVDIATLQNGIMELSFTNGIGINAMVNFSINEFIKNDEKLDTTFALTNEPLTVIIDLKGYNLDLNLDLDPQIINYKSIIDIPSDEEMTLSFGQSIAIDVLIDSLSFSSISGYVEPVIVDIDSVKQVIDLPSEVEDLNFYQLQMEFSFLSNIELPVVLDLVLSSYNDETGESFSKIIDGVNIIETPNFMVDDLQDLININPNSLLAYGTAEVGSLTEYGSVSTQDTLAGRLKVLAPLAFEIDDSSSIKIEAQSLEKIDTIEQIKSVKVFLDYENNFEFGANAVVLVSQDTANFYNGLADTLTHLTIIPDTSLIDSLTLDQNSFEILYQSGNYTKTILNVLGKENGPTRFLSTDTLNIKLYMGAQLIIEHVN